MAFHARISDPRVGGTYLTLLNTVTNFGGNWCQTLALWLVDGLTWTACVGASIPGLNCGGKMNAKVRFCFSVTLCNKTTLLLHCIISVRIILNYKKVHVITRLIFRMVTLGIFCADSKSGTNVIVKRKISGTRIDYQASSAQVLFSFVLFTHSTGQSRWKPD